MKLKNLLFVFCLALLAGCRDTVPSAGSPAPGSLSVTAGGYVGMAGGVVSQSR